MLDQYPVHHMPKTWQSDSMDEAAEYVGRDRLQSIIQACGGGKYADSGWLRLPTFEEMLICVNTINTNTEAEVGVAEDRQPSWTEYYTGNLNTVVDETILARFVPYEVKVLLERK